MLDLLLTNGSIHTMEGSCPHASAIGIAAGRIVAVGERKDVEHLTGPGTRRENLEGAAVIPGLVDAHIHWQWTGMNLLRVSLFDLPTRAAALEAVAGRHREIPPGEWLTGFGWSQGPWTDTGGAFPDRHDLDRVAPGRPVYLSSRSGHAAWGNSMALKIAGIDRSTPDPNGGAIQRDAHGEPTGILFETAMDLVQRHVPIPGIEEVATQMEKAQLLAWQCGLTGLHDYDWTPAFEAMQLLHERGRLGLRILKQVNDPIIQQAHDVGLRYGFGDDWLRLGALKIFADGALGSVTAAMIEPFNGHPDNRGIVVTPREQMEALVLAATRRGIPSTIHAIGDRAVRDVLDVYTAARRLEAELGIPRHARRHRIEHVQIVHPDDVNRLAELDVIGSFQPIHATSDQPVADALWGDRCALAYNPRVQIDRGVVVAFGSDSPVEIFDPFAGIHAAVTRRRPDGSPGPDGWYPEARVTVAEAIHGYTTGPAWAAGLERVSGRIAPGCLADLLVLDRDPFEIEPMELLGVKVKGTMVGGVWRQRI